MFRKVATCLCMTLVVALAFVERAIADDYEDWVLIDRGRDSSIHLYARSVWGECKNVEWRISNTKEEFYTVIASVEGASYQCTDGTRVDIRSPFREFEAISEGLRNGYSWVVLDKCVCTNHGGLMRVSATLDSRTTAVSKSRLPSIDTPEGW